MPRGGVGTPLKSDEPAIRWKVRVGALGEDPQSLAIRRLRRQVRRSPRVQTMLSRYADRLRGTYSKRAGRPLALRTAHRTQGDGRIRTSHPRCADGLDLLERQ